jgi:hypothetical protein
MLSLLQNWSNRKSIFDLLAFFENGTKNGLGCIFGRLEEVIGPFFTKTSGHPAACLTTEVCTYISCALLYLGGCTYMYVSIVSILVLLFQEKIFW